MAVLQRVFEVDIYLKAIPLYAVCHPPSVAFWFRRGGPSGVVKFDRVPAVIARLLSLAERFTKLLIQGRSLNSLPVLATMVPFCLRLCLDKAFGSVVRRLHIKENWLVALSLLGAWDEKCGLPTLKFCILCRSIS